MAVSERAPSLYTTSSSACIASVVRTKSPIVGQWLLSAPKPLALSTPCVSRLATLRDTQGRQSLLNSSLMSMIHVVGAAQETSSFVPLPGSVTDTQPRKPLLLRRSWTAAPLTVQARMARIVATVKRIVTRCYV
ncbi:hypothetical protein BDW22DRAFT_222593 [Trametopsis cervina]|nr:hypothetical protein BDW22DRAFT_222593 [Trametopsis cervina]